MVLWAWKWSIHHLAQSSKMKRWPFLSLLASKKYPITLTYWHGGGRQLIFTISQHCEFISSGTEMKMETPHLVCEEKPIFSRHCCVMVHWDLSSSDCSFSALGVWLPLPRGVSPGDPKGPNLETSAHRLLPQPQCQALFSTVRAPSSLQFLLLPNPPHHHNPASTGNAAMTILAPWLEWKHERCGAFQLVLFVPMDLRAGAGLSPGEELSTGQLAAPVQGRRAQSRVRIDARRG